MNILKSSSAELDSRIVVSSHSSSVKAFFYWRRLGSSLASSLVGAGSDQGIAFLIVLHTNRIERNAKTATINITANKKES